MQLVGSISYGSAALLFALLGVLLLTSWRGRLQGGLLLLACGLSAAWSLVLAARGISIPVSLNTVFFLEVLRSGAWLAFIAALAGSLGVSKPLRFTAHATWMLALLVGTLLVTFRWLGHTEQTVGGVLILGGIGMALVGLVLVEQVYRVAPSETRWAVKFLCLGVGGMFAYDLFLFSQAYVMQSINEHVWAARGFANALVVPMIAISARRNPHWSVDIFVSRHVVFYSAVITAAGIYLVVISLAGLYVRQFGGGWGQVAEAVFLFGAVAGLLGLLASERLRARAKVFLAKHFYRNRYDYRDEWLRLIDTLSDTTELADARTLSIKAMAEILQCPGGVLWSWSQDDERYIPVSAYKETLPVGLTWGKHESLPSYLARTQWIIELAEWRRYPERYLDLDLPKAVQSYGLIVPLFLHKRLAGFIGLGCDGREFDLNFEDRDLLKTVGRQLATHIARQDLDVQLTENRQFDAYNKLTAFLMHDLKNVIAQLSLIRQNAEKHRANPEFFDDVMDTVSNSVQRMEKLVLHLSAPAGGSEVGRVELDEVINLAITHCRNREPQPVLANDTEPGLRVLADQDGLTQVLEHLLRNAQDATAKDGRVTVCAGKVGDEICVELTDNGEGMSPEFVRDRLFRPFESTKGSKGMGIGAYQARESVRRMGGRVEVRSEPKRGTQFRIFLAEATSSLPSDSISPEANTTTTDGELCGID